MGTKSKHRYVSRMDIERLIYLNPEWQSFSLLVTLFHVEKDVEPYTCILIISSLLLAISKLQNLIMLLVKHEYLFLLFHLDNLFSLR